jgi:adenine-specific DNA-methyltransferase
MAKKQNTKTIAAFKHDEATRKNIPTAEYQSVMQKNEQRPIRVAYERRNRDLDPQLVWRGKDEQDWSDLVVHASPLYIQEKVRLCCRNSHGGDLWVFLRCETQETQNQVSPPQLA